MDIIEQTANTQDTFSYESETGGKIATKVLATFKGKRNSISFTFFLFNIENGQLGFVLSSVFRDGMKIKGNSKLFTKISNELRQEIENKQDEIRERIDPMFGIEKSGGQKLLDEEFGNGIRRVLGRILIDETKEGHAENYYKITFGGGINEYYRCEVEVFVDFEDNTGFVNSLKIGDDVILTTDARFDDFQQNYFSLLRLAVGNFIQEYEDYDLDLQPHLRAMVGDSVYQLQLAAKKKGIFFHYQDAQDLYTELPDGEYDGAIGHFDIWKIPQPTSKVNVANGMIDLISIVGLFPDGYNERDDHTCMNGIGYNPEKNRIEVNLDS